MRTFPKAGRYELLEELGRGAMGVVYKAQDPVIGRNVAVKTMHLTEAGTGLTRAELSARFQTEARAAGLLSHPNIVTVYDAGEEEGFFYITMEYVEGRSLQALLDERQSFPLPRVLRLMEQACSALEYAHQHNVVHRDIKPANLMLASGEELKITDFGTAKILQFGTTQTAHIIGTPSYMSPEQVKGKRVNGRSDIFALGVVLYELVTGEKPFRGQNITTVIYKIVNEEPVAPRELDSSIHPGLSYLITRALAKEPAARYQTCGEMLEALRNYRELGPSPQATVALPAEPAIIGAGPANALARAPAAPRNATLELLPRQESEKKRANAWLALLLLAIIAGASYRVWPTVREVWQRSRSSPVSSVASTHSQAAASPIESGSLPRAPAAPAAPGESDRSKVETLLRETKQVATSASAVRAKPDAPQKSTEASTPQLSSRAAEMKSLLEQKLAQVGLGDKVRVHVQGDTFTLTGRLIPREHGELVRLLRDSPAWIRLVDNIEYAVPEPGDRASVNERPPAAAGRGEMEVTTDVQGASALLRGPKGGVRGTCTTPCRFEGLWPNRYFLEVSQKATGVNNGSSRFPPEIRFT
ncbi:MAG TPA: serine/threonine-protein kinase [Candidatus Acidoferrales bacterium]|nr:serine/threonine-protein kinase [Candidatus Acidoferrales bacterium]